MAIDFRAARQNLLTAYRTMGEKEKADEESKVVERIVKQNPRGAEELPPLPVDDLFSVQPPKQNVCAYTPALCKRMTPAICLSD